MRATWSGAVTFGMVSIHVKLYTATEDRSIHFKQVHKDCGTAIKQPKHCPACDVDVDMTDIVKGYEVSKDQLLIVSDADLMHLPLAAAKAVEVVAVVPLRDVPLLAFDKGYYVAPAEVVGHKPFVLFRDALTEEQAALGKVSMRGGRESLCLIRRQGRLLVLHTLLWADEIRSTRELVESFDDVVCSQQEQELAQQLLASLTLESAEEAFMVDGLQDSYRNALEQVIEAKLAGQELPTPIIAAAAPPDLMVALRASVEEAKQRRSA